MSNLRQQPTIMCLGDALVDHYLIGTAERVSPEAPIPVVKITEDFLLPGGAANVAENLRRLGAKVVTRFGTYRPIKNRLMVGDTQVARWDEHDFCLELEVPSEKEFAGVDAVVVADYCKGSVTDWVIEKLSARCSKPIFVDTKGRPQAWLMLKDRVTMFPNEKECSQYRELYRQFPKVVLKRGAKGLQSGEATAVPAAAKKVRSVNGAGDTVVAAYAYAMTMGIADPLAFANEAAAVAVEKPYTTAVSFQEVLDHYHQGREAVAA